MHLEPFEYEKPNSLVELEALLSKHADEARLLAGGTDLLVLVKEKILSPKMIIDIGDVAALQGITADPAKGLTILAGTKVSTIEHSAEVKEFAPALSFAAAQLGSSQVRHMATMAGNVCHGSPSAETSPVLLAHGAVLTIAKAGGERELPISDFWLAYRKTALAPGEYLKAFTLPALPKNAAVEYAFKGLRGAMEIDMVNVGVYLELEEDLETVKEVRIGMGAVGPIPYRAVKAEAELKGMKVDDAFFAKAGELAAAEATPIDDVRATADYRKKLMSVLTRRAFSAAFARIKGE